MARMTLARAAANASLVGVSTTAIHPVYAMLECEKSTSSPAGYSLITTSASQKAFSLNS
jgi:hypothetical protein